MGCSHLSHPLNSSGAQPAKAGTPNPGHVPGSGQSHQLKPELQTQLSELEPRGKRTLFAKREQVFISSEVEGVLPDSRSRHNPFPQLGASQDRRLIGGAEHGNRAVDRSKIEPAMAATDEV